MTKLNLDSTYDIHYVSPDLSTFSFISILKNGKQVELVIQITKHRDPHLSGVYNLAFGPLDLKGEIDDKVVLKHSDLGKVFSTIILCAITFLDNIESGISIGIDGSNDVRAYLYHRMFVSNHEKLSEIITTVGVDWYVRLLRNGTDIERDADSYPLFKPRPEPFDLNRTSVDLYRYYMFSLNE
jgi:hypothetical protein